MLRLGAVSYLNTKPLIHSLQDRLGVSGRLTLDVPSRLADDLRHGRLDVALIPSIEYFQNENYQLVSDAVIACRGPVWSVRLLSRVPVREIRRLALDEGSLTSGVLAQVLLVEMYGLRPDTIPLQIGQSPESVAADAILMIGDRAMHPAQGVYREIWDLGDRWCRWTELPFVFAMWVARPGLQDHIDAASVDIMTLPNMLEASRDSGLANLEQISQEESAALGMTKEDVHRYLAENLHFRLGPGERLGLEAFRRKAFDLGFIPQKSPTPD